MFYRFLAILCLVCLMPMAAHAWSLNTWVKSGGGSIIVDGGVPQTSVNGLVYKTYVTSQPLTVTVNANTGYNISQVNYNGVVTISPSQTSYTVQGPNAQNVFATFAAQRLTVTASTSIGGTVNLKSLSNIYYGSKLYAATSFTFTPGSSTAYVASITGLPAGATVSNALPAAAGAQVHVTLPAGFIFTSDINLYATFAGPPVANAGPPQVILLGKPATLDGSSSIGSISSYSWTQTAGPGFATNKVIADNTPGAKVTFTSLVAGDYKFTLTVTDGSTATTTVIFTDNIAGVARTQCYNCHSATSIGVASNVFGKWSSSGHKTKGVICAQCHVGSNNGGHPGTHTNGSVSETTFNYNAVFGSGNYCTNCHSSSIVTDFAASKHSTRAGSASCSFCHVQGVHNPSAVCTDCHKTDNAFGLEWPPVGFSFHSSFSGNDLCKICHNPHNPKIIRINCAQ